MHRPTPRILLRSILFTGVLLISQQAFCWGLLGHRVIGQIAEMHLSKKAKKELHKLIGKETLALWSNWPDFIKSDSAWNHVSPWHYVNVPGHLPKEKFMEALKNIPGKSLYSQIPAMMAELKDKSLPLEQRKRALIFLVHFVGDLHQPLHVGRAEDLGGNRVVVYWFDKKTNLHTVWDSMLMEYQQYSYTEYSNLLDIAAKEDIRKWSETSLEDCFYESYTLANGVYDSTPAESKLGYSYNFKFQKIMEQQLLKGGIRLAAMLNQAFE
jgi:hypothetical protein